MKQFIPTNRIPSSFARVQDSGQVKQSRKRDWSMQKNIPPHILASIREERRKRAARGLIG